MGNYPAKCYTKFPVDPYLFPARGRKLDFLGLAELVNGHAVDPYLFPARGRKHDTKFGR